MLLRRVAKLAVPCLLTSPLYAEETIANLASVVVTATRTARTADASLAAVSVITREEIDRRKVTSVQEVLRGVPGVNLSNNGGLGKATSVFMRGTEAGHVLVLIDGLRVGSATLGTASFENLPIDQIERIEVVRGPRSSLYGSEAIGGVIQIFTRKGGGKLTPSFSAGGGSHGTYKLSAGMSGGGDRYWYNGNWSRLASDGFNSCNGDPVSLGGCGTIEPDRDGYSNDSGSLRLGYRFDNGTELEGNLLHAEGRNAFDQGEFDANFNPVENFRNYSTFVQQAVGGKLKLRPTRNWLMTVQAGRSLDGLTSFDTAVTRSVFDTERVSTSWQNDFTLSTDTILTAGLDYYHDAVSSSVDFTTRSGRIDGRDNGAGFLQYQGTIHGLDLIAAYRHDSNSQFGGNDTGNISMGYTFNDYLRVTTSLGRAFKAPTFNDLYYPAYGNQNLVPEVSRTAEFGLSGKVSALQWALNGYYTEVSNMIIPAQIGPDVYRAQNIGAAKILGWESTLSTELAGVKINATYSLLDPRNDGAENHDRLLPRRAPQMFRLDLDRRIGSFDIGTTVYGEGRRFDDLANSHRLGGYVTVDLRAGVLIAKHLQLEGRVSNLLDKDYETARLYNQDGRNFFISLRYVPDANTSASTN
jgi:vitamin B12 transporter